MKTVAKYTHSIHNHWVSKKNHLKLDFFEKKIFYLANKEKKSNNWKYIWSKSGSAFMLETLEIAKNLHCQ